MKEHVNLNTLQIQAMVNDLAGQCSYSADALGKGKADFAGLGQMLTLKADRDALALKADRIEVAERLIVARRGLASSFDSELSRKADRDQVDELLLLVARRTRDAVDELLLLKADRDAVDELHRLKADRIEVAEKADLSHVEYLAGRLLHSVLSRKADRDRVDELLLLRQTALRWPKRLICRTSRTSPEDSTPS